MHSSGGMLLAILSRADPEALLELFGKLEDVWIADFFGDFSGPQIDVV